MTDKLTSEEIARVTEHFRQVAIEEAEVREVNLRSELIKAKLPTLNHHDVGAYLYSAIHTVDTGDWVDRFVWADSVEAAKKLYPEYDFYRVIDSEGNVDLEAALFGF